MRVPMATLDEEIRTCNQNGIALAQQGRLEEAASWFRQALALSPDARTGGRADSVPLHLDSREPLERELALAREVVAQPGFLQ
jgi:hypothetical protein